MGYAGPARLAGSPVSLYPAVDDVDAVHARALAAGASERMAVADQFDGDRRGTVVDPFGQRVGKISGQSAADKGYSDKSRGELTGGNRPESEIGQVGGGKRRFAGTIDAAMIQSLVRREIVAEDVAGYGHVVVDECHPVPAISFERVMNAVTARCVTGLIATPKRRDDLIIEDLLNAIRRGRSPLFLTERRDHLDAVAERLRPSAYGM